MNLARALFSGLWLRARRSAAVWFSLAVILFMALVAALAPLLAPHDPYENSYSQSNLPPMWVQTITPPGSAEFPLGTDRFGRDILSRMLYAASTAFILAIAAVSLAGATGTLAGLAAGYFGGKTETAILLLADITQAVPGFMAAVIIIMVMRGLLKPSWPSGLLTLTLAFSAYSWAGLARLARIHTLQIKSRPFIEASLALGASPSQIIFHHLLTNLLPTLLVWVINNIPAVILLEAVLGYIGVGITSAVDGGEFTVVSWGGLFFAGRSAMLRNPLMLVIPSLSILLFSISFILLADFFNDIFRRENL